MRFLLFHKLLFFLLPFLLPPSSSIAFSSPSRRLSSSPSHSCLIVCLLSCAHGQEDGYATAKHDDGDIQLLLRRQGFLKNVDGDWGRGSQGAFDKWAKENYGDAYNGQDRHHEMFLKHYGIPKAYLLGLFSPRRHSQFAKIPSQLCKGSACAHFLRKEALAGFARMQAAAFADGVDLVWSKE